MKRKFLIWFSCSLFIFNFSIAAYAASLSDLAVEQLEKEFVTTGTRNPFAPAEVSEEITIESLLLEGLLMSKNVKMGLISGKIIQEGTTLGPFTVKEILAGEVVLTKDSEDHHLKLEGYMPPIVKGEREGYHIEFRNADIRDALRFLSKAEGLNLITPEEMSGRVNLSFAHIAIRNAMRAILKVNNYSYAIESGVMRVGKPDEFQGGSDLMANAFSLKYAKAKELVDQVKPLLSDKGSAAADERTNTLSVKDFDANVENVRAYLEKIDRKDEQVLIEAHIVDATNDFSRALGVQWGISGTPNRITISGADSTGSFKIGSSATATPAQVNLGAANPTSGAGFRIGRLPGGTSIDVQLTAAEQRGDIHIISKPSVTTVNNMAASIRSGTTIYTKSTSNINVGTTAGSAAAGTSNIQAIQTGIQLDVTPQITPNDYIKLTIKANESEADFSRTVDGIPAILDNTATTTVVLRDGETAVIGGLIKSKDTQTKKAVPGLSKIPIAGLFFKSKSTAKTQNELMVFITPKILK